MNVRSEDPNPLRNEVFTRVFDAHWAAVRHHVEGVVGDDEEVTEIVSEVFFHAWARLRPARPPGRVWLLREADRRLRSRTTRSSMPHGALDAVHTGVSGDEQQLGRFGRVEVVRALGVLTQPQRRIIMLTYWDGLAVGEIAELLRASESRVQKTLSRAQDRLRSELGLEGAGDG
ncbi:MULTISPECIES: RNA polymerase sigma factor [unclassified Microbacterium]|uniref:RNA polymerase sigma factor n=1 Tax=unclassified Microbacterium TaxID=2609290 RepID=UPI001604AEEC|nr:MULTISPECIES: sigma-70 family RNA polymerase sigma factor [unclassified Microbacterium]QNA92808.1 sigma-70 family RNA polymerase sigma factor [Microbacterium sp. Se63.02b]QYM62953.1 sigma-70 family RNA polymerase sigma factor [Microbacterium sp. Se5.02b]